MTRPRSPIVFSCRVIAALLIAALASPALAVRLDLDPPAEGEFVRDLGEMITPGGEQRIKDVASRLLDDTSTPIIVITIESMARHGGRDLRIETFATLLFDQWGIGEPTRDGKPWDTGVLLLVSKNDRKARIELGRGWRRAYDGRATDIMDRTIIPRFKRGDFNGGIVAGTEALDRLAREFVREVREENRRTTGAIPPVVQADPGQPPRPAVERPDYPAGADAPPATPGPEPAEPPRAEPPPVRVPSERFPAEPDSYPVRRPSAGGILGGSLLCVLIGAAIVVMIVVSIIRSLTRAITRPTPPPIPFGGFGHRRSYSSGPGLLTGRGARLFALNAGGGRRRRYGGGGFGSSFGSSSRGSGGGFFSSRSSGSSFGSSRSSGGGSRSFGRGSSGGGGATGSW